MSEKDIVLDLQNLRVRFETEDGIVYAVNGMDLKLEKGKAIGLVGETGAGKTTTALALLRLVPDPPGAGTAPAAHYRPPPLWADQRRWN